VGPVSFSSSLRRDELAARELLGRVLEVGPGLALRRDGHHGRSLWPTGQVTRPEALDAQAERHRPLADCQRPVGWASLPGPDDVSVTGFAPVGASIVTLSGLSSSACSVSPSEAVPVVGLADLAEVLVERDRLVPPQDREAELPVEAPLVGAFQRRRSR
jgi:hypothetical protein